MTAKTKEVVVYTDGACQPNPGVGGYGVVLIRGRKRTELSGGFRATTNNRMEIFSVIAGLRAIGGKGCKVTVVTDSRYVVDGVVSAVKWKANGWRLDRKHMAKNADLWDELLAVRGGHDVQFQWVRGHSDNAENQRCDELAVEARQKEGLPADEGYEQPRTPDDPSQPTLFDLV